MIEALYKKNRPDGGECQFLWRLKSQVSLAQCYERRFMIKPHRLKQSAKTIFEAHGK